MQYNAPVCQPCLVRFLKENEKKPASVCNSKGPTLLISPQFTKKTLDDERGVIDETLFRSIRYNPRHVVYYLLPPPKTLATIYARAHTNLAYSPNSCNLQQNQPTLTNVVFRYVLINYMTILTLYYLLGVCYKPWCHHRQPAKHVRPCRFTLSGVLFPTTSTSASQIVTYR